MKCIWSPDYEVDIGDHVFPTDKYRLIREYLLEKEILTDADFLLPSPASDEDLLTVHTQSYLNDLNNLEKTPRTLYSELPLRQDIIDAYKLAAGGTILACRQALLSRPAISCHLGGGFHHAFADHAEGFCFINDIAVGIRVLQKEGLITHATVIDCDLHQGNGTAHIFQENPSVITVSLHQENNYPHKQTSTIDVGLDDYTQDDEYLAHLQEVLPDALDKQKPDLVIYAAGADPYQDDVLGRLKLTMHGLYDRDRIVLEACVSRGIPVVTVTAGGYAQHVSDTVAIHAQTVEIAAALYKQGNV